MHIAFVRCPTYLRAIQSLLEATAQRLDLAEESVCGLTDDATRPHPLSNQPLFLLIVPDLLSPPPDPVLRVWSLSLCHVGVHFCRDAGQEEHNHVLVLSRAVRGHHVYDTDPTEDAVLFFQSHRALCTDLIDGAARIHTATGLRRKINFR